jgi:release factor glutamine methyltransferase
MTTGEEMRSQPKTLGQLLDGATAVLTAKGIELPQVDAEILLGHILGCARAQLYARLEETPDAAVEEDYNSLIARRLEHEPVAYITGHKEFYGLDLHVDRRVLIPRPETETLVEVSLAVARQHHIPLIADVGAGSGAIAIALALNLPWVEIVAIDASPEALEVAEQNCRRHGVLDRVHLLLGNLLDPLPEPVGLIVANLPYVSRDELKDLPPDITSYEPLSAIDGGQDGLDHIRAMLAQARPNLKPPGIVCLEIGASHALAANELVREYFPGATLALVKDLAGLDRVALILT